MNSSKSTGAKPEKADYQADLQATAGKLADRLMVIEDYNEACAVAYGVLREETLKSWKNGIEAGKRKAARPPREKKRGFAPRRRPEAPAR